MPTDARAAELATSLGALRSRIAHACDTVGRDPHSVTLIAVTKTYPVADVVALARLGVRDVGESKDQEARAKVAELAELAELADSSVRGNDSADPAQTAALRWHLVGRLQTNKARSVVGYAHAVHSVDRAKLARALADAAAREQRSAPLEVFVQVSLDGDPARGGVLEAELPALADLVAGRTELRLRGLMAVAPMGADPEQAFARLAELADRVRRDHPGAQSISAGMSNDLEAAIANGATHVRVGTALLGRRATSFG